MNRTIKFMNNVLIREVVGDRGLRAYRKPIDGRLGIPGLSQLVLEETGHEPKEEEAYAFHVKNRDRMKILSRDHIGLSVVELYGKQAKEMKADLMEMAML